MKSVFTIVFLFTSFAFASDNFESFKQNFSAAVEPKLENLAGWHSGRCYTSREPEIEKAGLMVVKASVDPATNQEGVKIIMPAGSVREEVNFWDQLDDEKIEVASSMMWPENMPFAQMENGSLANILFYDMPNYPSGKISVRQNEQGYQLRFGDIYDDAEWIYCRLDKKVLGE
ncbi:MAG: hypothetical protein KUL82_01170 [Bdellovibrio sp.]|nr:hypothetical protein [Bdellovibrio sp.]